MCKFVFHEIRKRKGALYIRHRSICKKLKYEHSITFCSLSSVYGLLGIKSEVVCVPGKHSKLSWINSYRENIFKLYYPLGNLHNNLWENREIMHLYEMKINDAMTHYIKRSFLVVQTESAPKHANISQCAPTEPSISSYSPKGRNPLQRRALL